MFLSTENGHCKDCKAVECVRKGQLLTPYTGTPTIEARKLPGESEYHKWVVYRCLDVGCHAELLIRADDIRNQAYYYLRNGEVEGG